MGSVIVVWLWAEIDNNIDKSIECLLEVDTNSPEEKKEALLLLSKAYIKVNKLQEAETILIELLDKEGNPVLEVVYFPGAKGIGGIAPPPPGSTSANLLAFLPPRVIERSDAVLYLAVAAAFVFVVVVFL